MKDAEVLLVIDMQQGSFTSKTPRFNTEGVVTRINELAQIFRANNLPVIFIQHDGTQMNEYIPNTPEWALLSTLSVYPDDIMIGKYANDVFYNSQLEAKLTALKAEKLYITGCATDFCVEATVQSALAKDYNIVVVEDGHTTAERPHLAADKIIEHYNWVWQNMIPTKGKIEVKSAKVIMDTFRCRI